jgi:vanillate O-demethylase monooxygenase subunit
MYPFAGDNTFVRNAWYVAATLSELEDGPKEKVIMDQPVAVFLTEAGVPAAIHGICAHRYYPLALGRVVGDSLQCKYHGFRFDGFSGACVEIPSQPEAPKAFRHRVYPAVAHGAWVWIWPGDPQKADRGLLPDLSLAGLSPAWNVQAGVGVLTNGRAQLLVENLLDLTHVDFLHAESLEAGSLLESPVEVSDDVTGVRAFRTGRAPWIDGFYDLIYGPQHRFAGTHGYVGESWYHSPGYIRTGVRVTDIDDRAEVDRSAYGTMYFQHFLTPSTPDSVYYYSAVARDYRLVDPAFDQTMVALDLEVRMQDVRAVELVEQQLKRPWTLVPELLSKADAGAMKVRRRLQKALEAEAQASAAQRSAA